MTAAATYELPHVRDGWADARAKLQALADKTARGLDALEHAFSLECDWQSVSTPLATLRGALSDASHVTEEVFCEALLPWLARTALSVEDLFVGSEGKLQVRACSLLGLHGFNSSPPPPPSSLQLLPSGFEGSVVVTRRQACCLLALAFFDLLAPVGGEASRQPNTRGPYQHLTLAVILTLDKGPWWVMGRQGHVPSQRSKLLCLLAYFRRVKEAEEAREEGFLAMKITFARRHLKGEREEEEEWRACSRPLCSFEKPDEGLIESAHGCLQVDFANEMIGGGVVGLGNVQVGVSRGGAYSSHYKFWCCVCIYMFSTYPPSFPLCPQHYNRRRYDLSLTPSALFPCSSVSA